MTEITIRDKKRGRVEFFSTPHKTLGRQFYWRTIASNGRTLARSSEGYQKASDCRKGFKAHVAVIMLYGLGGK